MDRVWQPGGRHPVCDEGRPLPWQVSRDHEMFGFYSNRLGCLGSIAVSLVGTAVLVLLSYFLSR
jgi:hypothetical protein